MLECGVGALYDYNVVMMSLKCLFCFRFILVFDLGTIPSTIGSLTAINFIDLDTNKLIGTAMCWIVLLLLWIYIYNY